MALTTRIPLAAPDGAIGGAGLAPGLHWRTWSDSGITRDSTSTMPSSTAAPAWRDIAPRITGKPDTVSDRPASWFRVLAFSITTPPDPVSRLLPTFVIQTDRIRDAYGAPRNQLLLALSRMSSLVRESHKRKLPPDRHGHVKCRAKVEPNEPGWPEPSTVQLGPFTRRVVSDRQIPEILAIAGHHCDE